MCCNSFVQIESAAGLPSLYIPACFLEYRKKDLTLRVGEKHWIWAADSLQQRLHSRYKQLCKFCSGIAHGRSCRSALQANCESFKFFQQKYQTTTSFSALSRLHAVRSVYYEVSWKRQSYLETMLANKIPFSRCNREGGALMRISVTWAKRQIFLYSHLVCGQKRPQGLKNAWLLCRWTGEW